MGTDRFITWTTERPTRNEIGQALTRYINTSGKVEWLEHGSRFYAEVIGDAMNPFIWKDEAASAELFAPPCNVRGFEVYVADGEPTDVITRGADAFTGAVAEGFAAAIAYRWKGTRGLPEEPDETDESEAALAAAWFERAEALVGTSAGTVAEQRQVVMDSLNAIGNAYTAMNRAAPPRPAATVSEGQFNLHDWFTKRRDNVRQLVATAPPAGAPLMSYEDGCTQFLRDAIRTFFQAARHGTPDAKVEATVNVLVGASLVLVHDPVTVGDWELALDVVRDEIDAGHGDRPDLAYLDFARLRLQVLRDGHGLELPSKSRSRALTEAVWALRRWLLAYAYVMDAQTSMQEGGLAWLRLQVMQRPQVAAPRPTRVG